MIKAVGAIPYVLPASLAAFSAAAMLLLVLNHLSNWSVWPIGIIVAVFTGLYVAKASSRVETPGTDFEKLVCNILVLVGVISWTAFNLPYSSQHINVDRDPGIYAVTGGWLIHHDDLHITAPNIFKDIPEVTANSSGFQQSTRNPHYLSAQGAHLFPVLLGLYGRIAGAASMLNLNVMIGALALLAFYGFSRLLLMPRWALLATAALSLTLPFIYFSRDSYTEPLALLATFSFLSLILLARRTYKPALWFIAGLVLGVGVMARVDAYLDIAAVLAYLAIALALTGRIQRKRALYASGLLVLGATASSLIGWQDVRLLSDGYYKSLAPDISKELLLIAAVSCAGLICILLAWKTPVINKLKKVKAGWVGILPPLFIVLFFLVLASRPLWYVGHTVTYSTRTGQPVLLHSYSEHTMQWIAWYAGPVVLILGVIGLARAVSRRVINLELMPVLLIVLINAGIYLISPNIFPDQIWAARRFLPVIIPGFIFFGLYALDGWTASRPGKNIKARRILVFAAACVIALGPMAATHPFITTKTYAGNLTQLQRACRYLPEKSVVVWAGTGQNTEQSTRSFCNTDALGVEADISDDLLARLYQDGRSRGETVVIAMYDEKYPDESEGMLSLQEKLPTVSRIDYSMLESSPAHYPHRLITKNKTIKMAILSGNGLLPITRNGGH